jgi:hypothetical protein
MGPLEPSHPVALANGPISLIGRVRLRMRARHLSAVTALDVHLEEMREQHGQDLRPVAGMSSCPTSYLSCLPSFVRDPSSRGRLRYPNDSGTDGASRRKYDNDLHPRPQSRRSCDHQSRRQVRLLTTGTRTVVTLGFDSPLEHPLHLNHQHTVLCDCRETKPFRSAMARFRPNRAATESYAIASSRRTEKKTIDFD